MTTRCGIVLDEAQEIHDRQVDINMTLSIHVSVRGKLS